MAGPRPQSVARGFSITLVGRVGAAVFGLLQIVVLAQVFGAGLATDAWNVAVSLPLLFLAVLTGPLHTSFIPVYVERQEQAGADACPPLVNGLYTLLLPLLAVAAVLFWLGAPGIVQVLAPGFHGERFATTVRVLRWLTPLLVVTGLAEFPVMLLLANRQYTWPAIGSLFYAAGVVVFTYTLGARHGIVMAALGGVVAVALEAVVLMTVLRRHFALPRLSRSVADPGVGQVLRLIWPRFVSIGGNRINLFVDNIFASLLATGVLTALSWGEKLTRIPLILFTGPLTRTIMPVLSRYASQGDTAALRDMLGRYLRLAGFIAAPVMAVFVFFPRETIRVFFQRGAFDETAVRLTAIALVGYGVGMLAYAYRLLISTVYFALQDSLTPMYYALMGIGVNAVADFLLMQAFGHGGIALATAVVETAVSFGLYRSLRRRLSTGKAGFGTRAAFAKCLGAAAVCGALAWAGARVAERFIGPPGFWRDLLLVAGACAPAGVLYVILCWQLGVEEVGAFRRLLRRPAEASA